MADNGQLVASSYVLTSSFVDIPSDVLVDLFCYFEVKDVAVISRVTRNTRMVIFDNPLFWYRFLTSSYLLRTIGKSSEHALPLTMECFTSNNRERQEEEIGHKRWTSVHGLAQFSPYEIDKVLIGEPHLVGAGNRNFNKLLDAEICERSIDIRQLRIHLQHWNITTHLNAFSLVDLQERRVFPYPYDCARLDYWPNSGLRCFHLSHYKNLERRFDLQLDPNDRVASKNLATPAGFAAYNPSINYRNVVFYDQFCKLRQKRWGAKEKHFRNLAALLHQSCKMLASVGPSFVANAKEKQRLLAPLRSLLPGSDADGATLEENIFTVPFDFRDLTALAKHVVQFYASN